MPLKNAIRKAGARPASDASRADKKHYSEVVSHEIARALAEQFRELGLAKTVPTTSQRGHQGGERRIAGGLGDKKVDVTCATDAAGLILAVSVKTISFPDQKTKNYQKNLQNRKADLAFEVTTLHKRFPYAVVGGMFLLYEDAKRDSFTKARVSTFDRAHQLLKMFTGRMGPKNEESKFEFLVVGLYNSNPARYQLFEAGKPKKPITFERFACELLRIVAERNPEDFVFHDGRVWKPSALGLPTEPTPDHEE